MSRFDRIHLSYRLIFDSAFHFGTGLRQGMVHRAVARNADGFLYVPGSTFKGVLRDRCEQLARLFGLTAMDPHTQTSARQEANPDLDIIVRLFGSRFRPSRLFFDDAQLSEADQELFEPTYRDRRMRERKRPEFRARQVEKRTQVSLSRLTRTAKKGHLFTSEYGIRDLTFTGKIVGVLPGIPITAKDDAGPDPCISYSLLLLIAGLKSLDSIGGNKSTGAGQARCIIDELQVNEQTCRPDKILERLGEVEYYLIAREEEEV